MREHEIANGRELVEVEVPVARFRQGELGASQLVVLHLQLDLIHLELVQELAGGAPEGARRRGLDKLRLRLVAQSLARFRPNALPAHALAPNLGSFRSRAGPTWYRSRCRRYDER